ncbi:hypothetical protein [Streptomyces sp. NBC_01304]|uniref:hypothetical protein n=1 Tax=Streptomyces sp. NBC_01304 TaxID=2903818 RepID=UPI002E13406A|nr:hypothetical protein OG430_09080 [Streptomyces sp. NBC_01304]
MIQTLPAVLPGALVDTHGIDLTPPSSQTSHSPRWRTSVDDVTVAPCGDVYTLTTALRNTWGVADDEPDPGVANFRYRIITRHSADGEVLASALCPSDDDGSASAVADGDDMTFCVLPDGTLSVNAHRDRTTLIAPDLSRVLATYASTEDRTAGNGFAGSISVTPSGRLLCTAAEYGVWGYGSRIANIVGLADGALTPDNRPLIEAISSLDPAPARHGDDDLTAQVRYQGSPVGREHRPRPALTELVAGADRLSGWHDSRLGRPVPLADDLFVVPVFAKIYRGGNLGQPFVFALVNDKGEMTGRLQGLDPRTESPFTGFCFTLAGDPYRGRAFHLNRYGMYAWDRSGALRARLDTAAKTFKPLTPFTLAGCAPDGDLLLFHRKQHLILRVPAPDDLADLPTVMEDALRTYAKQRTALKKAWAPVDWHWVHASVPVGRL